MKKTLIAVAAAAALTTSAFAEITFGAWLRVLTAPVASDGKDTVAVMANSWGWESARAARLNVNATSEDGKIGFVMGLYQDVFNGTDPLGDESYIWAKPVDMLKISMGHYDNNTLRGDCCYGSWNWLRPNTAWMYDDEGLLMSGITGLTKRDGLLLEATPVDGLYIQALVPVTTKKQKAEDVYKDARAGFGYNIEGIGKIKAQYLGMGDDKRLEAEFDLSAVENLWVGVGFGMNMWDKEDAHAADEKMKIALGATYQVSDELKLSASGAFKTCVKGKSDGGHDGRFQAGVGVDYNLGDGLGVNADVRYLAKDNDTDKTDHVAFSVGVTKGISSNGYIGAAFQAQTNGGQFGGNSLEANPEKADKLIWCVPVAISCWF